MYYISRRQGGRRGSKIADFETTQFMVVGKYFNKIIDIFISCMYIVLIFTELFYRNPAIWNVRDVSRKFDEGYFPRNASF